MPDTQPSNSPIIVIGAGPAGITAASRLSQSGREVIVLEADERVGGLAKSITLWDQTVDLGPHRFFSNDKRVNQWWLSVIGRDYRMVNRLTRIYYRKRFFHYPLQALNALKNLGVVEAVGCMMSYLQEKCRPRKPADKLEAFSDWVISRFGERLFNTFFKTYSEKLWGISCDDLDSDFAAQRIKKFSLGEALKSVFSTVKSNHKTLVDRFAYPLGGTGVAYERMAETIKRNGGQVLTSTPVRRVLQEGGRVTGVETADGRRFASDHVISTMPMTLMARSLGDVPPQVEQALSHLKFRNTILVYLLVDRADLFPDQWLYIHSPDLRTGRLTNFRNWVPHLHGDSPKSILALEYWCYENDPEWSQSDDELIRLATDEIESTGLLHGARVEEGRVLRLPRCYPVYSRGYKQHLIPCVEWLKTFQGLQVIGRYGAFKYNNQDHSILMGLLAAENITKNAGHDLWSVNTDYESYQESAIISESGLVDVPHE